MEKSYRAERAKKDIEKYEELRALLPDFCLSYLSDKGIRCKTDTLVMTCRDLLDFFKWLIFANPSLKEKEPRELALTDLNNLTFDDINEFQSYRLHVAGNKPSRVARMMSSVRTFFKYEYSHGFLSKDPTSGSATVRIVRDKSITKMEPDEVKTLVSAVENSRSKSARTRKMQEKNKYRDTAIIVLLLNTGIRISELVGLNLQDVNLESSAPSIFVTRKGGGSDQVFLNNNAVEALANYINLEREQYLPSEEDSSLFLSNRHKRFTVRSVQKMVEKFVKEALPQRNDIHVHTFRKTYGTTLYDITGDIKMVQDVLGHADPSTTSRYYIGSNHKREAKDIDPYG